MERKKAFEIEGGINKKFGFVDGASIDEKFDMFYESIKLVASNADLYIANKKLSARRNITMP